MRPGGFRSLTRRELWTMRGDGFYRFIREVFAADERRERGAIRGDGFYRFVRQGAAHDVELLKRWTIRGDGLDRFVREVLSAGQLAAMAMIASFVRLSQFSMLMEVTDTKLVAWNRTL